MEINESIIIIIIINLYHTCRPRKANVDNLFSASVKKKKTVPDVNLNSLIVCPENHTLFGGEYPFRPNEGEPLGLRPVQ